jgi:molecular chaperone DnaK (HSP70)
MAGTLAIDLGSSTTVVAFQPPGGEARLLALAPFSLAQPTVVPTLLWLAAADSATALLGRQVLDAGLAQQGGPQLQRDFKRLIGSPRGPQTPAADASGLPLSPEAAGARLLLQLWGALPPGLEPERLVLTAPIDTYAGYRRWLQALAEQLPVPEVALVDEPTAAAIGCGLPPGSTVLVVDLGGGTVDLSLVRLEGGEGRAAPIAQLLRLGGRSLQGSRQQLRCARVLGKAGLALGGRDIDRWIAAQLAPEQPASGELLALAEQLKCQLSEAPMARAIASGNGSSPSRELQLSRQELASLLEQHGFLAQLDGLLEAVLAQGRSAGIQPEQIDAVLPVGGCSRLPAIATWLQQRLAPIPIRGQRPVEAVALGALALTPGVQVRDVLSRGAALRCWDQRSARHHWQPLFLPGQSWPTQEPLELLLACSRDGQQALELVLGEPRAEQRAEVVFEGGIPVLRHRPTGQPSVDPWPRQPAPLPLDPPGRQGQDRLRLRFWIDDSSELQLEVIDLETPANNRRLALGPVR